MGGKRDSLGTNDSSKFRKGLGVRDLPIITRPANMKRASKFWDSSDSMLSLDQGEAY